MIINGIILFFAVVIPAFWATRVINIGKGTFRFFLVFAGAYLFSITVVHILPELFQEERHSLIGLMVLAGFFFQQVLEYFSAGVEHGHMHLDDHPGNSWRFGSLLLAMTLHAFLEGTILSHPAAHGEEHDISALMAGIVLHKIPASVALVAILMSQNKSKSKLLFQMLLFALASPLGLFLGNLWLTGDNQSDIFFPFLFAFVSGNFLHISTTIVFETSPDHKFDLSRFAISLLGAIVAILTEFII